MGVLAPMSASEIDTARLSQGLTDSAPTCVYVLVVSWLSSAAD